MILDKKLSVDRVASRITEEYESFLNVMFSDENAETLVLRIRWASAGGTCTCAVWGIAGRTMHYIHGDGLYVCCMLGWTLTMLSLAH